MSPPTISVSTGLQDKTRESVDYSTRGMNGYWIEQGMSQEMVHVAGAVAQIGVHDQRRRC
jgi:hypothetical protein